MAASSSISSISFSKPFEQLRLTNIWMKTPLSATVMGNGHFYHSHLGWCNVISVPFWRYLSVGSGAIYNLHSKGERLCSGKSKECQVRAKAEEILALERQNCWIEFAVVHSKVSRKEKESLYLSLTPGKGVLSAQFVHLMPGNDKGMGVALCLRLSRNVNALGSQYTAWYILCALGLNPLLTWFTTSLCRVQIVNWFLTWSNLCNYAFLNKNITGFAIQ